MTRTFTGRLWRALLRAPDVYGAELPYNLNWARPLTADARALLARSPLVVCDVGARGGAPLELEPFYDLIEYLGFDADADECERLSRLPHPHARARWFPYFITDRSRPVTFHLFKQPGESSEYLPDPAYAEALGGPDFSVARTFQLDGHSLDDVRDRERLPQPDFIKLDTQGSEAAILDGARGTLAEVAMVEVEIEFVRAYAGQGMAADVLARLDAAGFEPLYLNRVTERRRAWRGRRGRGQLVFGDLLAGRKLSGIATWTADRRARYALLLANYGYYGHVRDLLAAHDDVRALLPEFARWMDTPMIAGRVSRVVNRWLEKLLLLALYLRGGQRGGYESDRGWPVE